MSTPDPIVAKSIEPGREGIRIVLSDRAIVIPWEKCSAKLAAAAETERMIARLSPSGYGIHWPLVDEDLAVGPLVKAAG